MRAASRFGLAEASSDFCRATFNGISSQRRLYASSVKKVFMLKKITQDFLQHEGWPESSHQNTFVTGRNHGVA
jgi:hypothetical protein